jgi:scyllo-inositol 2-dehydrogenase (NADP+)
MSGKAIGTALIGFGLAGEVFHAPLIQSARALTLRAVVSSRKDAVAAAGLRPVAEAGEVLADPEIALVVIATPNATHHALARAALAAGKHVVVDKPLAVSAGEARDLIAFAAARGLALSPFHNRRWDGDFLTVRGLLAEGKLGVVQLCEACWDRHRPRVASHWKEEATQGGGIVNDLAPHLIDQALLLFGRPASVSAEILRQRENAGVDDYFDIRLHYGARIVRLSGSMLAAAPRPRFQLHGTAGSFVKSGLDPQQGQLKDGLRPGRAGYGAEPRPQYGLLTPAGGGAARVRTERGSWQSFYRQMARAAAGKGPLPVDPEAAVLGLEIIEAARLSANLGRTVEPWAAASDKA